MEKETSSGTKVRNATERMLMISSSNFGKFQKEYLCWFRLFGGGMASSALPPLPPGEEIYDLRSWVPIPFPWVETILGYLGIFIVLWIFAKFYIRRRNQSDDAQIEAPPPPDPLEEALAGLERIRSSPLWNSGKIKDITEHLTRVLKIYLRDRFHFGLGSASTSDELIEALEKTNAEKVCLTKVRELMDFCDSIKFAKGTLGVTTIDELLERIRELIVAEGWNRR